MNRRRFLAALCSTSVLHTIVAADDEMRKAMIVRAKCVGCGDCVRVCPMTAITLDNGKAVVDPDKCVGCRKCVMTCSFGAPRL